MSPTKHTLAAKESDRHLLCSEFSKDGASECMRTLCAVSNWIWPRFSVKGIVCLSYRVDGSLPGGKRLYYVYLRGISIPEHGNWRAINLKSTLGAGEDAAGKSSGCSCTGPKLGSQQQHGISSSCLWLQPPGHLTPLASTPANPHVDTHT